MIGGKTPNITMVKTENTDIKRIVYQLYDRLMIPEPMIDKVVPTVYVLNIWVIREPRDVETEDERQLIKQIKCEEKDSGMKARIESINSK